jgi:hypothetical protein
VIAVLLLAAWTATALAQSHLDSPYYARTNTFGLFSAYSGDSSHILLGYAEHRRLLEIGASYNRRLLLNHKVNWQYSGELLPVALESDPVESDAYTITYTSPPLTITGVNQQPIAGSCVASTGTINLSGGAGTESYFTTCTRRWTIGEAMSPVGMQWNFLPRRKVQPLITGHGGYMYSTRPIPVFGAGSFNFTFDIGAGFELYRSKSRSIRAEYRYHHISNHETANENPGIDNGLFQVTYAFGR